MTLPERPPAVPAGAVFEPERSLWELYEHDATGARHGAFVTFRPDGALFTRGSYQSGKLDGAASRYTSGAPGAPALRACCVPEAARELRTTYRDGRVLHEVFYDASGHPLSDDGTPWPERPANVPKEAIYDDLSAHFVLRRERDDGGHTVSYFNVEGWLEEELDGRGTERQARRRFAPDGTCVEETGLLGERQPHGTYAPHGPYVARVGSGNERYVDSRIREVRGEHDHGEPVGEWELRDATGATFHRVAMGERLPASSLPHVDGKAAPCTTSPRLTVAHAARRLAKDRDIARFERALAEHALSLKPEFARSRAEDAALAKDASASSVLGAVLAGAAPAVALRRLSSLFTGHAPASIDYLDAAVLLAPEQELVALTRGLLCIEHGDPDGAHAAADALAAESAPASTLLHDFCRITYAAPTFRPGAEGVTVPDEELVELEPVQPLASVRRSIALYATRLALIGRELEGRGVSAWADSATRDLLPDGPLELRRFTARIEDEGENGTEVTEVTIDETLELTGSTRELLHRARADWAGLGWLCWSTGLDRIALPSTIAPPATFVAAMHQATLRCWRAHDRVRTKGLVALARKAASFVWEGTAIDDVPPHLAELVASEYLEVRAQFLWLLYEQNISPFQSDLRVV